MENGTSARSEAAGENGGFDAAGAHLNGAAANGSAPANGQVPISARLLGVGVRGVRGVGKATGIDRAVEIAAEEAIVGAIESEAVERAIARVLRGPVVEDAVNEVLESEAVKRALLEAMDSELVDEVWRRLLASEEAQQLVERIAGAPELRAAISAQGAGLLDDIARTIARVVRDVDDRFERIVRRIFFRPQRQAPSPDAGFVSRALAYVIDGAFVNLAFTALFALISMLDTAFGSGTGNRSVAIAIGSTTWLAMGTLYLLTFWGLAGQTPGMRFVGIRLAGGRLRPRRGFRRALGFYLSIVTFGIGFLGVVFRENRSGWEDRFSGVEVVYEERRPDPAPWSQPEPPTQPLEPPPAEPPVATVPAAPGPVSPPGV